MTREGGIVHEQACAYWVSARAKLVGLGRTTPAPFVVDQGLPAIETDHGSSVRICCGWLLSLQLGYCVAVALEFCGYGFEVASGGMEGGDDDLVLSLAVGCCKGGVVAVRVVGVVRMVVFGTQWVVRCWAEHVEERVDDVFCGCERGALLIDRRRRKKMNL